MMTDAGHYKYHRARHWTALPKVICYISQSRGNSVVIPYRMQILMMTPTSYGLVDGLKEVSS